MKKTLAGLIAAVGLVSMNASAAMLISKDEAHHFKYEYIDNITVAASGGQIS
ncbi:DUF1471 domain-containing protein, partial [Escherichia coli]|nr:DUF1471 domain-containing protein [Escherichia coli]